MISRNGNGPKMTRCAIYTRVSTSMQAEGEFSSIDNQRESAEALIRSQASNGWIALETCYDDAGFSASTMNRPALQQLLADVESGLVDVVVVYKLDRLSRNQRNLLELLDGFSKREVTFRSVTQNFDTSGSMGRAMIGMLGVFAELERGMISERTRDKVMAARQHGRWTGGILPLGYDLVDGKLKPNKAEAHQVREMYRLYLQYRTLTGTLGEVKRRNWKTKSWTTKSGGLREGRPFTVDSLKRLLASPYYAGRISSGDEIVNAEHEAIIDPALWEETQRLLATNATSGGRKTRNKSGALLKGILRCACGRPMTPTRARKGAVQYPYYTCSRRRREGAASCPNGRVSASKVETAVIEQIRIASQDAELVEATVAAAHAERDRQLEALRAEVRLTEAETTRLAQEEGKLAAALGRGGRAAEVAEHRIEELRERSESLDSRLACLRSQIEVIEADPVDEDDLRRTLETFEVVWEVLEPVERCHLVRLLVAAAEYDGHNGELTLSLGSLHPIEEEADNELTEATA